MVRSSTPVHGREDFDTRVDEGCDGWRQAWVEPSTAGESGEGCCGADDLDEAEDCGCGASEEIGAAGWVEAWKKG